MDEITYESLAAMSVHSLYTDHILHFKALFEAMRESGPPLDLFFEWGCGYSSKLFLDAFDRVTSVEIITPGTEQGEWMGKCIKQFGCARWNAAIFDATYGSAVYAACAYQGSQQKTYADIDETYRFVLQDYFRHMTRNAKPTVVFVDPGVMIRGDLVEMALADSIPIVIAHDTASKHSARVATPDGIDSYAWTQIRERPEYERIFIDYGCGTTMWIDKQHPKLIQAMQDYSQQFSP